MTSRLPLAAILTLTLTLAGPALARATDRPALTTTARALIAMPHERFVALAKAGAAPFDWSTDGCTATPVVWARTFAKPCRQHDFGYRNLGYGLRLSPTEATRRWVDQRFHEEMRSVCDASVRIIRRLTCRARARLMWAAVRVANRAWH
ncbi:unannotated protein [freshwater metagenome]|uniref:Unannotated protein n=1 Tax=freshwater metagenome TaxID=449393 RepID=A0A6J7E8V8_9ZZZZ|nr:hypothetical protein [Actinomycetota bacterium]